MNIPTPSSPFSNGTEERASNEIDYWRDSSYRALATLRKVIDDLEGVVSERDNARTMCQALEEENARLTEALEQIDGQSAYWATRIARDALAICHDLPSDGVA